EEPTPVEDYSELDTFLSENPDVHQDLDQRLGQPQTDSELRSNAVAVEQAKRAKELSNSMAEMQRDNALTRAYESLDNPEEAWDSANELLSANATPEQISGFVNEWSQVDPINASVWAGEISKSYAQQKETQQALEQAKAWAAEQQRQQ